MNRRCAFLHISDPKQRCKLFDSLILPILSYASKVSKEFDQSKSPRLQLQRLENCLDLDMLVRFGLFMMRWAIQQNNCIGSFETCTWR